MNFIMDINYSGGDSLLGSMLAVFAFFAITFVISVLYYVFVSITLTAIFKKMNHPQPAIAWIPVYRFWVLLELGNQKGWWAVIPVGASFLTAIPVIGNLIHFAAYVLYLVVLIYALINLNKGFKKEVTLWTVLGALVPPVWLGVLAWGKDTYDPRLANGPYFLTEAPVVATQPTYNQEYAPTSYLQTPVATYPQDFETAPETYNGPSYGVPPVVPAPVVAPNLNPYTAHDSSEVPEAPTTEAIPSDSKVSEVIEPEEKDK